MSRVVTFKQLPHVELTEADVVVAVVFFVGFVVDFEVVVSWLLLFWFLLTGAAVVVDVVFFGVFVVAFEVVVSSAKTTAKHVSNIATFTKIFKLEFHISYLNNSCKKMVRTSGQHSYMISFFI